MDSLTGKKPDGHGNADRIILLGITHLTRHISLIYGLVSAGLTAGNEFFNRHSINSSFRISLVYPSDLSIAQRVLHLFHGALILNRLPSCLRVFLGRLDVFHVYRFESTSPAQ